MKETSNYPEELLLDAIFSVQREHVPLTPEKKEQLRAKISEILETSRFIERSVIEIRYFQEDAMYTFREIGSIFKRSGSRIQQIHCAAIQKLQHSANIRQIEEVLKKKVSF